MLGGISNARGQQGHLFRGVLSKNLSIRGWRLGWTSGPLSLHPIHPYPPAFYTLKYSPAPGPGLRSNNSRRRLLVSEGSFMLLSLETSFSLLLLLYLLSGAFCLGAPGESEGRWRCSAYPVTLILSLLSQTPSSSRPAISHGLLSPGQRSWGKSQ